MAVVGPSGCGKTTLLELICGLQRPDAGRVEAAPAALMPQRDLLLPWLSALDNAGLALRARGMPASEARAAAAPWLERFGLAGFERARPAELSGGMRQRVSFLRTLLAGKPVLALDEPFASLDAITRAEMQGWLAHVLDAEPRTVVLVTHDVEEAVVLADRVVVMSPRPGTGGRRDRGRAASGRGGGPTRDVVALRERALAGAGGEPNEARAQRAAGRGPRCWWRCSASGSCTSTCGGADPLAALPAPHQVAKALYDDRSLLWSNFLVTAEEVLLGILVAAVAGLGLAIAIHFSRTLRRAVYPLLVASQAIPIPIFAPLLVAVARLRDRCRSCVVIALVSFFPIVVTTLAGLAAVDPELLKLMRTFDASRLRTFRHVELPAALPGVFTGAKIAVAVAVIGAVFAEQSAARRRASGTCSSHVEQPAADAARRTPPS